MESEDLITIPFAFSLYVAIAFLHEVMHSLLLWAFGIPSVINFRIGGIGLVEASTVPLGPVAGMTNTLVASAGILSSVVVVSALVLISRDRVGTAVWGLMFVSADIAINLLSGIGDGAYIPLPRIPVEFIPIFTVLRLIALVQIAKNSIERKDVPINWL